LCRLSDNFLNFNQLTDMDNSQLSLAIIDQIGKMANQPNELGKFLSDFRDATVRWIRPLFLIDDTEDDDYAAFNRNPNDADSKNIVLAKVKKALNNDAEMQACFTELLHKMQVSGQSIHYSTSISGAGNLVMQGSNNNSITLNK
jgi:hypothetical protein